MYDFNNFIKQIPVVTTNNILEMLHTKIQMILIMSIYILNN